MKISNRLNCIANLIPKNSRVIDVGCDHALLSIYLDLEKKCSCIAADINANALNGAKINLKKYNSNNVKIKLTDGINDIDVNENDYIVIAGMGTTTIKHILDNKKLSDNLIICSNNQWYELRKFVSSLGYKIAQEEFVIEHQKKYVIIHFKKGKKHYSKLDLKYGPFLKNNSYYLIYELEKLFQIKEKIKNSKFIVKYKNSKEIKRVSKLINRVKGK